MNRMPIKWLYQELPGLVEKGVLTQETAERVHKYYGEVKGVSGAGFALIICATIGAFLIGLGIILLFAHNWEQFSRLTRAILSIAPLVIGQALALWVLLKRPKSGAFKEGSATFLSLMVGASIALISQTYNIPGDVGTFILTWMFLILPLVYLMRASLPAVIYLIGITSWVGSNWDSPAKVALFWPLAAVILPHFIWALHQEIYTLRTTILSLVMVICVLFASGFSLAKSWPGSWVIILPSIYAAIYFIGCWKFSGITTNWQRSLRFIGAIGLFVLAFQFTFSYVWKYLGEYSYSAYRDVPAASLLPANLVSLVIIGIALLLFYDNVKRKKITIALVGAVPLLAIVAYFVKGQSVFLPLMIFNVYLFVLSLNHIIVGIRNSSLSVVNKGMLMLALLIIARFFDSNISFVIKSLVFIIVGIGFLVTNAILAPRIGGAK